MSATTNKIKIAAATREEWDKIKEKLDFLPYSVLQQIESADSSFSIVTCHIKKVFSDNPKLYIPHELVTQITVGPDYTGIYCGDYYFKALKEEFQYEYIFIKMNSESK